MKEIDYEALNPSQLDQVSFCELTDAALTKPHECRWLLDDDGELVGYRRPKMFDRGTPVKWQIEVISLETGNPIPLITDDDLKEAQKAGKKKARARRVEDDDETNGSDGNLYGVSQGDTQWIDIHQIAVAGNVRQKFPEADLVEMRANFQKRGFRPEISRLTVRPRAGDAEKPYELVIGGRRFRAATDCGISPVPCVVADLADEEIIEYQLIENLKRKELTPLDEAEAITQLLEMKDAAGWNVHTVQSLAELLDYSTSHITRSRALSRLRGTPAGDAVDAKLLSATHGELLGTVLDPAKRDELTARIMRTSDGRGALPKDVLAKWIADEVHVQLRGLEFDPDKTDLVPPYVENAVRLWGGDCGTCPRNSKNTPDDERDARAVPLCTHPGCFKAKVQTAQQQWRAAMEEKGCTVLSPAEAQKILDPQTGTRLAANSGYVELVETPATWEVRDDITAPAPWKKLIKGQGVKTTVFKDTKGTVHEVVEREIAIRAAVENKHDIFKPSVKEAKVEETTPAVDAAAIPAVERAAASIANDNSSAEDRRKAERKEQRESRISAAQFDAVVAGAQGTKIPDGFWPLLFHGIMRVLEEQGELGLVAARHGFEGDYRHAFDFMLKKTAKLEAPFRVPLLVELMFGLITSEEAEKELPQWAKVFGVDLKKVKRTTEALLDDEEAAAREAEEIANGVVWSSEKKGVEFTWEGNAVTNPDVAALAIPGGKFNVMVAVAHHVKGWVVGWSVEETKKKPKSRSEDCVAGGTTYGNRVLAFRTGLLAARVALGELGAPPQAIQRIEAYIAAVEAPAEKKAAKAAKKGGR